MIDSGLVGSGRDTTRAEDAQETSTQSHISPSVLEYEDYIKFIYMGAHLLKGAKYAVPFRTQVYLAYKKQQPPLAPPSSTRRRLTVGS